MKTQYRTYKTTQQLKVRFMDEIVIVPKNSLVDNKVCDGCYEDERIWIDYPKDHYLSHDLEYRGLRIPKGKTILTTDTIGE